MAVPGNTFSDLVREVWTPELKQTIWFNSWMFDQSLFQIKPSPGGRTISTGYQTAVSSNVGTYAYDEPMPEPYTSTEVKAYFNKDWFQEAARVFKQYLDSMKNGGTEPQFDAVRNSIEVAMKNIRDKISTTMIADLITQIDSSTAYSDASLSRTTYASLKSYEEATSTALTLAHMEDMVEAIDDHVTYGQTVGDLAAECVFLMPRNQLTNLSRLATGASAFEFTSSTQNPADIDVGRVHRVAKFEQIPIVVVPDMTSTVILLVHKPSTIVYETRPFEIEEKDEPADTMLWHLTAAYNIVCHSPGNSGKLSGKTA